MAVDTSKIGTPTSHGTVTVERSAITAFARAVTDENPIYANAEAARQAGFEAIPAPPTFPFAMEFSGKFAEDQPADAGDPNAVLGTIIGPLMAKGGIILHGEQAFSYKRPVQAGDVLVKEGKIADIYEKDTGNAVMTFVVVEEAWREQGSDEVVCTSRMNLIHRGPKEG